MAINATSLVQAASGGSGSLGVLYVKLAADVTGLNAGFREAETIITRGAGVLKTSAMVATAAITAMAVAAVVEFTKFEQSFANVRKTVKATEEEFKSLEFQFRKMATQLPTNVNDINEIAAAAGQLGVQKENIAAFTRVMIDLGNTTNLKGEVAAQSLARLANITGTSQKEFDRLGSTISELDRNSATTASQIMTMALRIAGAGRTIGMSESDILGFSAALSSIGVAAEAGGTAITTTMMEIAKAVALGGDQLQAFSRVALMSSDDFKKLFHENATEAILQFVEGLKAIEDAGGDAFITLDKLGLDGARIARTLISAAESGDSFRKMIETGSKAWKENTTLSEMANERYKTMSSHFSITGNLVRELAIRIGESLAPTVDGLNKSIQDSLNSTDGWAASLVNFAKEAVPRTIEALHALKLQMDDVKTVGSKFWEVVVEPAVIGFGLMTGAVKEYMEKYKEMQQQYISVDAGPSNGRGAKPLGPPVPFPEQMGPSFAEFFDGFINLEVQAPKTAVAISKTTAEIEKMNKAAIEARTQDVEKVLKNIEAPDLRDTTNKPRGMTKAEMELGAIHGIGDPLRQRQLETEIELDTLNNKIFELKKLGDQEGKIAEDVNKRKLDALKLYTDRAKQLRDQERQLIMAQNVFMMENLTKISDDMLTIGAAFFGKQTAMYHAMFAASKAFAIAESTVKIMQGIANAASLPWPLNLGAIASVVAATANIVSTIQSVKLEFGGARALGGPVSSGKAFLVGERGPEMFVPRGNGKIVPNNQLGGSGQIVIHNYADVRPQVHTRDDNGTKITEIILRRVRDELASDIRSGEGPVNRELERNFTVRRRGQ